MSVRYADVGVSPDILTKHLLCVFEAPQNAQIIEMLRQPQYKPFFRNSCLHVSWELKA